MRILLVDDDAFLRDMYALKFSESGHAVDAVDSGAAAIAKWEQGNEYDVVLLDMVMPSMTGVEILKELRGAYPDASTVYIVLSNQGEPSDIREATDAGAAGYIIKAECIPSEVLEQVDVIVRKAHGNG